MYQAARPQWPGCFLFFVLICYLDLLNQLCKMDTASSYFQHVRTQFEIHGNPETAQGQMWYMRHQFEFFGLKMPQWMAITKTIHKEKGLPEGEDLKALARLCFADDHREMHYFALETVQKSLKTQDAGFIDFLEELICTRSWWDTVDWLAKLVGIHLKRFPELRYPVCDRFLASGNFWLQRVSMIFQLLYKNDTDAELLFRNIRAVADSKEFFLQKGAGWALRQYSKVNPEAVRAFIENTRLAPLTRREGTKYLNPVKNR